MTYSKSSKRQNDLLKIQQQAKGERGAFALEVLLLEEDVVVVLEVGDEFAFRGRSGCVCDNNE